MNQLLPIIRRVRRPLLPAEVAAPLAKADGNLEPLNAEPRTLNGAEEEPETNNATDTSNAGAE